MQKQKSYGDLPPWGWAINLGLMLLIAVLAIVQTGRGRELPFREFQEHARAIGLALEAFARDHGGRYPADGVDNNSPPGLSTRAISRTAAWGWGKNSIDSRQLTTSNVRGAGTSAPVGVPAGGH